MNLVGFARIKQLLKEHCTETIEYELDNPIYADVREEAHINVRIYEPNQDIKANIAIIDNVVRLSIDEGYKIRQEDLMDIFNIMTALKLIVR